MKSGGLRTKQVGGNTMRARIALTAALTAAFIAGQSAPSPAVELNVTHVGIGAGLTALREGAVDMTYVTQPVWANEKDNFRLVFNSTEWAPRVTQTVGVVKTEFLKKNPNLIRGIIQARRKAVEFIKKNPDEAAAIMAKEYKIDEAQAKAAIKDVVAAGGVYWSPGDFDYEGMNTMLKGLQLVKAVEPGPFDWAKIVDDSY